MKLGLELAAQGQAPLFCPSALVTSNFPTSDTGTNAQRQRWEQGHISLILSAAPSLFLAATKQRDIKLLATALDLAIPPLSLLVSILAVVAMIAALAAILGLSAKPLFLISVCLLLVLAAILMAWIKHGRDVLPIHSLVLIVPYVTKKLTLYAALATGRRVARWIRTDRN
jgi:cellulose synthase/poly-beta-1,6-N-acetylglucosamine synthase-like glycosyltransferase